MLIFLFQLINVSQNVKQYFGPKEDPVQAMYKIACGLKIVQFVTFAAYWLSLGAPQFDQITAVRFLIFVVFFAIGQALNAGIYKAIGIDGVYYGCRLGKTIPWYNGFPFNVCPHPQYVGSALSFWGIAILLWNADYHLNLLFGAALMTAYYGVTLYIEDNM